MLSHPSVTITTPLKMKTHKKMRWHICIKSSQEEDINKKGLEEKLTSYTTTLPLGIYNLQHLHIYNYNYTTTTTSASLLQYQLLL